MTLSTNTTFQSSTITWIQNLIQTVIMWCIGGFAYVLMELAARSKSHWTMFIVGGICFVLIDWINEFRKDLKMELQGVIGSLIVTVVEFISGCIINLYFGWDVWDYSNLPFNILGQVCIPFSIIWFFVAILSIYVGDLLRKVLFNQPWKSHDWYLPCLDKLF